MLNMKDERESLRSIKDLCEEYKKNNQIDAEYYENLDVKRGLRNADGTGVLAGLTRISNVHGYVLNEGEREAVPGQLFYRGYSVNDIISSCTDEQRFGYEEVVYLLLFGELPGEKKLNRFREVIAQFMDLPNEFFEDMILKAPSSNIMNKMARSMLALYSYDESGDDTDILAELGRSLQLIAKISNIMVKAYQVKRRHYDGETMYLHPLIPGLSIAEEILSLLRNDREYTKEEALLLDICLMLHAEHGGGNNSTFACRVLSSTGTDAYSAYAGAIGSLKGPMHGGANIKALEMVNNIKENVRDYTDVNSVHNYLSKIVEKQANDGSGLIYGMGHAVYTVSDPRAVILKECAAKLSKNLGFEDDFALLNIIENETPKVFAEHGKKKDLCANVDLYSGLVYTMLKIPVDLFTPLFATSRMAGWSAHRIEELFTGNRIVRPAYKSIVKPREYIKLDKRINL